MCTAHHPLTYGRSEVINRCLQQYLRTFVHYKPKNWGRYLDWAEWCYNTSVHSASGLTPFKQYMVETPPIPSHIMGSSNIDAIESTLNIREDKLGFLRANLLRAQEKLKNQADLHRTALEFNIGDWVYL